MQALSELEPAALVFDGVPDAPSHFLQRIRDGQAARIANRAHIDPQSDATILTDQTQEQPADLSEEAQQHLAATRNSIWNDANPWSVEQPPTSLPAANLQLQI